MILEEGFTAANLRADATDHGLWKMVIGRSRGFKRWVGEDTKNLQPRNLWLILPVIMCL